MAALLKAFQRAWIFDAAEEIDGMRGPPVPSLCDRYYLLTEIICRTGML